jgi:hypothetical protein
LAVFSFKFFVNEVLRWRFFGPKYMKIGYQISNPRNLTVQKRYLKCNFFYCFAFNDYENLIMFQMFSAYKTAKNYAIWSDTIFYDFIVCCAA